MTPAQLERIAAAIGSLVPWCAGIAWCVHAFTAR